MRAALLVRLHAHRSRTCRLPIVAINSDLGEPPQPQARIRKVLPVRGRWPARAFPDDGRPQARFNPALDAEVTALLGAAGS